MTKKICFIANYFKTYVFIEIAKVLEDQGVDTFWIIPRKKQYSELKAIFPEDKLLYIGVKETLNYTQANCNYDIKLNELIYGDRVLSIESQETSFKYLTHLKNRVYDFIASKKIEFIFGEITWAHELVAHRLTVQAKELNCEFLNPHTIRIPNGRFAFFEDEFQSQIKEVNALNTSNNSEVIKPEKPSYLAINNKKISEKGTLKYNLTKLKNFITRTNQDANDPTLYSKPWLQFKVKTKEIINRIAFKNFVSETQFSRLETSNTSFALFTLHKQPEASIDVIGRYYENQLQLIKNIWRILPEDYTLLVKEHSNAIGDRPLSFYKKLKALKNVVLIDSKEDSYKLLDISKVVFTVSGTIAYEAALKNVKAYTFAPAFFNKLNYCSEISWKDFRSYNSLKEIISEEATPNTQEFSDWLLQNSFEGIMSDAFGNPKCMEGDNIVKLANAFLKIIEC